MALVLPPALSAWLRRANQHPNQKQLCLSGSSLIAAICPSARKPEDIDYASISEYESGALVAMISTIATYEDPADRLEIREISEIYEYNEDFPGLRATLVSHTSNATTSGGIFDKITEVWSNLTSPIKNSATQPWTVDISFGEPFVVPARMIDIAEVGPVLCVAPESLFAWKVHALVQFGEYYWRPKDLYDIRVLWNEGNLNRAELPKALEVAFAVRESTFEDLDFIRKNDEWASEDWNEEMWDDFMAYYQLTGSFQQAVQDIRLILDKVL